MWRASWLWAVALGVALGAVVNGASLHPVRNGRWRDGHLNLGGVDRGTTLDNSRVSIAWFQQRLDHFNDIDLRTWSQKYWVNDQFYKPGGPVFLMLGGEGSTSRHWIDPTDPGGVADWLKNAATFGALCFQLEHRYYGDSHPTPDLSTDNLKWLSSKQALADVASFIDGMNAMYQLNDAKWVTFGGSYSGALSAWARLKYPHKIVGAVASSAPVQAQVDFQQYLGVVADSLGSYSSDCLDTVRTATQTVATLMQSDQGRQQLKADLKLCDDIDPSNTLDIANLYSNLAGNYMGVVQYSRDNRGIYADVLTIDKVCPILTVPNGQLPWYHYVQANSYILNAYGMSCLSFKYSDMISYLQTQDWSDSAKQWTYQTCTEFGYYQDSDLASQPFGNAFPLSFSLQQCADIFGPQLTSASIYGSIDETNLYYGARNLQAANIILPNGSTDPWHALGILNNVNPLTRAVFIPGTAHCADMYPPRAEDVPELVNARQQITIQLSNWLKPPMH